MPYNYLLVSWGSSGNLNPLLTAGRQLRRAGHGVRVLADPAMRGEIEAANFPFLTWRRAPTGSAADPSDISDMRDWLRRALYEPAGAYAADVRDEVWRRPTDAVLCIDILFAATLGAQAAGVPVAMLSPHISIRPLPGMPPCMSGMGQPSKPEELAAAAAATDHLMATFDAHRHIMNDACAQFGFPGMDHVLDLYDRADRVLLAISQAFDFQAHALPENYRYIGPLLDQPGWSKPWQAPWTTGSARPRALIACSTGAQGQTELVQQVLDAFAMLEIDAVATVGPNVNVDTLDAPANVHLLHSAPHDEVMKEISLVVTQGGHGTVCRALMNGLPQLVLPSGRDQADNAARVEGKGVGLRLAPTACAAEITAAVKQLVQEPNFRAEARRLGAAVAADVDASRLVDEMEAMVAKRPRGQSSGRKILDPVRV